MSRDFLKGALDYYDVIVIGSGLGGLTGANTLAKQGYKVLVLEHHYQFGGLATWFTRKRGHIFDISLHGFPVGMIKSCRKYWTREIADSIDQIRNIRFINPQFDVQTTFDRADFTRILIEKFHISQEQVNAFFEHLNQMNYYDRDTRTTQELFEQFFPGRTDVHRLLLEPIAYANGSTLEDPAITYGIVFSNFMNKGVYIFHGGTDTLIAKMVQELQKNGVDLRKRCLVEKIVVEDVPLSNVEKESEKKRIAGVIVNGRLIRCGSVLSNSNIKNTLLKLVGEEKLPKQFAQACKAVRVNSSSCQVYIGIREGEKIPNIGDLIFTSSSQEFSTEELLDFRTSSKTYSLYYPEMRPHQEIPRYSIVCSINAKWEDWQKLSESDYLLAKERLMEEALQGLEKFIPDVRQKVDWLEAATPRTVNRYTTHWMGTSFGTKFEGLAVSMDMPKYIEGLYHAGSVGIIMSGWLGTMNYGVIVANKMDSYLNTQLNIQSMQAEAFPQVTN